MKLTARVRAAIPDLLAYLHEDTPHTVESRPERKRNGAFVAGGHPMYRRLTKEREQALHDLLTWLKENSRVQDSTGVSD
jgi:hypothetical protein